MKGIMERFFVTSILVFFCLIFGLVIMVLNISSAWSAAETHHFPIIMLIVSALSYFFIPWCFTDFDDKYWYLYSIAVSLPCIILFTDILVTNLSLGHFPGIIALFLFISVMASLSGGYLKKSRIRKSHPTRE
jgi:hypothetical protein